MNVVVLLTGAQMQNLRPPKPLTPLGLCGIVWHSSSFYISNSTWHCYYYCFGQTNWLKLNKYFFLWPLFLPYPHISFWDSFSTRKPPSRMAVPWWYVSLGLIVWKVCVCPSLFHFSRMYAFVQCARVHVCVCSREDERVDVRDHCQVTTSTIALRPVIWDRVLNEPAATDWPDGLACKLWDPPVATLPCNAQVADTHDHTQQTQTLVCGGQALFHPSHRPAPLSLLKALSLLFVLFQVVETRKGEKTAD